MMDNKIKSSIFVVLIYSKRKTKNNANANFGFIVQLFGKEYHIISQVVVSSIFF